MPKTKKKTAQQIATQAARLAKQAGEAVVKEGVEVARTAVGQVTGIETSSQGGQPVPKTQEEADQMREAEKKRQEELAFYRRQLKEMEKESQKVVSQKQQEEWVQKQAEVSQKRKPTGPSGPVTAPGGKSKRGTALIGGRGKSKKKGFFEGGGQAAKRSK